MQDCHVEKEHGKRFIHSHTRSILIVLLFVFSLSACSSDTDYSTVERQGKIIEVDRERERILVNDSEHGQIWIDLSNISGDHARYHPPLEVNVWLDGPVQESDPAHGKAKKIQVIK